MTVLILLAAIVLLFVLRVPMAFAILGPCLAYLMIEGYSLGLAIRLTASGINSWPLLAVPLFILVGVVATRTEIADRLFDAALRLLGGLRAGLAYVNIGVSLGFSWMSGAALADAAGLGAIEVGQMRRRGYPANFSVGLTAGSALISPVMPPSIPAVVYASVAGVSIAALFAAAILPALIITVMLTATVFLWSRRRPDLGGEKREPGKTRAAVLRALPPMGAPLVILGGILSGLFTPTEAAGMGALYMLVLAALYGTLRLRQLALMIRDTSLVSAQIMLIIGASSLLSWILAREQVPQHVAQALLGFTDNVLIFLLIINAVLIVLGMLLEPTSALLIVTPILLPVAVEFGVDPLQFGVIIIFNLMFGLITPPMGGVAFVLSSVTKIPVERVFRGALFFMPALLIALAIITYLPEVTMLLPRLLGLR
jgi:tripartite ATP-independent transporter DctM subunit